MITLSQKIKRECSKISQPAQDRISIRDHLLVKEIQEMEQTLPSTCSLQFSDANILHEFELCICPDEGFWNGGSYKFYVTVPEEYNMVPPKVICLTKIWHPNIAVSGEICLSLLRHNSIDGLGWSPIRRLRDVIWGLHALFTDLLNFEDPLNIEAADQYCRDKNEFRKKVQHFASLYARR